MEVHCCLLSFSARANNLKTAEDYKRCAVVSGISEYMDLNLGDRYNSDMNILLNILNSVRADGGIITCFRMGHIDPFNSRNRYNRLLKVVFINTHLCKNFIKNFSLFCKYYPHHQISRLVRVRPSLSPEDLKKHNSRFRPRMAPLEAASELQNIDDGHESISDLNMDTSQEFERPSVHAKQRNKDRDMPPPRTPLKSVPRSAAKRPAASDNASSTNSPRPESKSSRSENPPLAVGDLVVPRSAPKGPSG
jgi:hypothetical protein